MDDQNQINQLKENKNSKLLEKKTSPVIVQMPETSPHSSDDGYVNEKIYPVNLSWYGLSYTVKRRIKKEYVTILKNVTGEAKAGELTAILGPSGAGKTTLLNILVGLIQEHVKGKIIMNGNERQLKTFQNLICFIQQQNEILPDLSLREILTIAANLKLDGNIPREEKCQIVKETLQFWGLYDCKDTMVQKLSGGQKKRLSIAQEVINKPPLILLDEPTSGLDSLSCVRCISVLKNLTLQGHNIICSIHQPTALIFEQFDRVCFLSEGECLYNGPRNDLLPFLLSCDLECPLHHNPADFVIEAALGEYGEGKAKKLVLANAEHYQMEINSFQSKCYSKVDCPIEIKTKQEYDGSVNKGIDQQCMTALLPLEQQATSTDNYKTSTCNQFLVLFDRAVIGMTRSRINNQLLLSSYIAIAVILGILFYGIGNDAKKILDNVSCLFFSMIFVSFASTMGTILIFPTEMPVIRREIFNKWYSVKAYYLARTLADIPLQILFPVIFGSIIYWMTNQNNEIARFVLFMCILIETSLISQTLGLCLGATCQMQVAVIMAPVGVLLPPLLFCGYFIRLSVIPSYLRWISYASFFRYSFEGILLANYGFNRTSLECSREPCQFENVDGFLEDMDMKDSTLYVNFIILTAFIIILRIFAFILLKWKATKPN